MTDSETTNQDYNIDFERIKELISKYEEIKHNFSIGRGYSEFSSVFRNYFINQIHNHGDTSCSHIPTTFFQLQISNIIRTFTRDGTP